MTSRAPSSEQPEDRQHPERLHAGWPAPRPDRTPTRSNRGGPSASARAAITYGASITHFDPPEGTNTPSTAGIQRDQRRKRRRRRDARRSAPASCSFRWVAGDHAGDAGIERKLQDDAPDRRRRVLHRAHQPRRRADGGRNADAAGTRSSGCSAFSAFSGSLALHEIANEIERRRARRRSTSSSGSARAHCPGVLAAAPRRPARFRGIARRSMPRSAAPSCLARPAASPATSPSSTTTISIDDRDRRSATRKIVWRNGMMPPGTMPPCGDDVADLRAAAPRASPSAAPPIRSSPCAQMLPSPRKLAAASAR